MQNLVKKRWTKPQLICLNLGKTEFVWYGTGADGIWNQVQNIDHNHPPQDVIGYS